MPFASHLVQSCCLFPIEMRISVHHVCPVGSELPSKGEGACSSQPKSWEKVLGNRGIYYRREEIYMLFLLLQLSVIAKGRGGVGSLCRK